MSERALTWKLEGLFPRVVGFSRAGEAIGKVYERSSERPDVWADIEGIALVVAIRRRERRVDLHFRERAELDVVGQRNESLSEEMRRLRSRRERQARTGAVTDGQRGFQLAFLKLDAKSAHAYIDECELYSMKSSDLERAQDDGWVRAS